VKCLARAFWGCQRRTAWGVLGQFEAGDSLGEPLRVSWSVLEQLVDVGRYESVRLLRAGRGACGKWALLCGNRRQLTI